MPDNFPTPPLLNERPTFGVWLPGIGWLRANVQPYAETVRDKAESTARRLGQGAHVEYIDTSLVALEQQFLAAEKVQKGTRNNFFSWLRVR